MDGKKFHFDQGLNIQAPWAMMIVDGQKTIETRTYNIPDRYLNVPIALVETPGRTGGFRARIVGLIWFSRSKLYETRKSFDADFVEHKVHRDSDYDWKPEKKKYGWVVAKVQKLRVPLPAPAPRGIVWTGKMA